FFSGSSLLRPGSLTRFRKNKFLLTLPRAPHFASTHTLHPCASDIRKGGTRQRRESLGTYDLALISLPRRRYINHRKCPSIQPDRSLCRSLFQGKSVLMMLFCPDHCAAPRASSEGE